MTEHHHHDHGHDEERRGPVVGADGLVDWDATYSASEQMWSGNPNIAVVSEVSDLAPGSAVDIGCGEGADAVWLATHGWQVTAFDVSSVAIDRAIQHAADADVEVDFRHGGLLDVDFSGEAFDLVSAQYPVLMHEAGRSLAALLALVAPGGTLLFVHHGDMDPDEMRERGFDPADYLQPADVHEAVAVDDGWTVKVFEDRMRHVETGAGAGHTKDVILRATRH